MVRLLLSRPRARVLPRGSGECECRNGSNASCARAPAPQLCAALERSAASRQVSDLWLPQRGERKHRAGRRSHSVCVSKTTEDHGRALQ
ncbi:hypothetical protein EYF80_033847 [Liparis tanakae]|uniref:Uncharacterized protein n=1 Tax=Liparis tanakae TaxID=230148 RepID=A0A4Z2GRS9_9TELE|nr:hypothetical protein EYF80_033847 [Liparis tanakae]